MNDSPLSAARSQAGCQSRRKVRREDAVLRRFQVIWRAVKMDDLRFRIEQREGRAPITVARLPHRSGINQVTSLRLQLQRYRLGLSNGPVFRTESVGTVAVGEEPSLQMRVAEEGEWRGQRQQRH